MDEERDMLENKIHQQNKIISATSSAPCCYSLWILLFFSPVSQEESFGEGALCWP